MKLKGEYDILQPPLAERHGFGWRSSLMPQSPGCWPERSGMITFSQKEENENGILETGSSERYFQNERFRRNR